jgi:predicted ATPase
VPLLTSVSLKPAANAEPDAYPFSVPAVRARPRLTFAAPVTFFVGENGSGKSTWLEAIAAAAALPAVGSDDLAGDATLAPARALARHVKLAWSGARARRGFFLRAEDFFGFTKRLAQLRSEMLHQIGALEAEYEAQDRSAYALGLAQGPMRSSLHDMERRYGVDLDANSHGQSFLKLFQSRLVPGGLYLLDEPEAPLSPQSQLALLTMLSDGVEDGAQFVIATHSPILLALPGAEIYSFDELPARLVAYEELEHVRLTRDFLNAPERYLRHLAAPPPTGGDLPRP